LAGGHIATAPHYVFKQLSVLIAITRFVPPTQTEEIPGQKTANQKGREKDSSTIKGIILKTVL